MRTNATENDYECKANIRRAGLGRRSSIYLASSPAVFVALPLSLSLNLACWLWTPPGWLVLGATVLLFGGALAQYFHGVLHRDDTPWFITGARNLRLLMTPRAHELHHATLTRDFSTTSGWSNPLLNAVFANLRRR